MPPSSFQFLFGIAALAHLPGSAVGFVASSRSPLASSSSSSRLRGAGDSAEKYVLSNYPSFYELLSRNVDAMKKIRTSESGFTIFAPTEAAFANLGEKRLGQLGDVRNEEMSEKIGAYHAVAEPVSADDLYNSGGIITAGGEVVVDRSMSGGMFGMGGKEDGGVQVNGSKVTNTFEFSDGPDEFTESGDGYGKNKFCVVHETDGLVSPDILWRYADQLRIPGSN